jgi:hypothetical protein
MRALLQMSRTQSQEALERKLVQAVIRRTAYPPFLLLTKYTTAADIESMIRSCETSA